jgi:hypothetical protein
MIMKRKYIFLLLIVTTFLILVVVPNTASSAEEGLKLSVPIPSATSTELTTRVSSIGEYAQSIYTFGIVLAVFFAIVFIVYAAIQFVVSRGDTGKIMDARDRITSAVYGLLLLIGAVLILNTINPELTGLDLTSNIESGYIPQPNDPAWIAQIPLETDKIAAARIYRQAREELWIGNTYKYAEELLQFYYLGDKSLLAPIFLNARIQGFPNETIADERNLTNMTTGDFQRLLTAESLVKKLVAEVPEPTINNTRTSKFKSTLKPLREGRISEQEFIQTIKDGPQRRAQAEAFDNEITGIFPNPDTRGVYAYFLLTYYYSDVESFGENTAAVDMILQSSRYQEYSPTNTLTQSAARSGITNFSGSFSEELKNVLLLAEQEAKTVSSRISSTYIDPQTGGLNRNVEGYFNYIDNLVEEARS